MTYTPDVLATPSLHSSKSAQHDSLDELFSLLSELSKMLNGLNSETLQMVRHDMNSFRNMTKDLHSQKSWQGWSTLSLTSLGASLAVLGSLIPKGGAPLQNKQLNDLINAVGGSAFLKQTANTAAKFFNGVSPVSDVWFQGKSTSLEANRSLKQLSFQEQQQIASGFLATLEKIQNSASGILQAHSKAG